MRLEKLTVNAFLCFAQETEIDFTKLGNSCLYLITGETGAGKTTIFDAISFALFGRASGDLRSDSFTLRSDFVVGKTPTSVELIFSIANNSYIVTRTMTTSKSEAYLTHIDRQIIATGIRNVTQKIEEIIGLNREQFAQITMIAQNDFLRFLKSNTTERQKILRKIFNTHLLQSFQDSLKIKAKALTIDLENLKAQFAKLDVNFYTRNEELLTKTKIHQELKVALDEIKTAVTDSKAIKEKLIFQLGQAEQLNKHFTALDNLQTTLAHYEEKNREMKKIASKIAISKTYLLHIYPLEKEITTSESNLRETIDSCNEYTEKLLIIDDSVTKLKQIKKNIPNLTKYEQTSTHNNKQINLLETRKKKLITLQHDYNYLVNKAIELTQKEAILTTYLNADQKLKININTLEKKIEALTTKSATFTTEKVTHEKIYESLLNINEKTKLLQKNQTQFNYVQQKYRELDNKIRTGEEFLLRQQAGFLAKMLIENKPCPVCGSTVHPRKATLLENDIYTEEKIVAMTKERQTLNDKREGLAATCAQIKAEINIFKKQINNVQSNILTSTNYERIIKKVACSLQNTNNDIKHLTKNKQKLLKKQTKIISNSENLQTKIASLQKLSLQLDTIITSQKENFKQRITELIDPENYSFTELNDILNNEINTTNNLHNLYLKFEQMKKLYVNINLHLCKILENNITKLETDLTTTTALKHSTNETLTTLKQKIKKSNDQLKTMLCTYKLTQQAKFKNEYFTELELTEAEKKLKSFEHEFNYNLKEKTRLEKEVIAKTRPNITILQDKINNLDEKLSVLEHDYETSLLKITNNKAVIKDLESLIQETEFTEKKYNLIAPLESIANGPLDLETYAQATYFEQIIIQANKRLAIMSQNRYKLIRQKDIKNKKRATGLELEVFDNYTTCARTTNSLSGGESFITSLSLALGLADIVQQNIGGTYLETMFIDEGFGTLDSESLELALNTLANISDNKRTIGIISHVAELRAKIKKQIIVEKHYAGSQIKTRG